MDWGTMGGSTNDDFFLVHDYCKDGHGVRAYLEAVLLDGNGNPYTLETSKYNGNGLDGDPVEWDPVGNLTPGEFINVRACLVDGPSDPTPSECGDWHPHSVIDG